MDFNLEEGSRKFLKEHLPSVLEAHTLREALILLDDLINEKGFAPPHYDEYNAFGEEAQRVCDDLYCNN